ncbi:MAG TPA: hypothetical protein VFS35_00795, partial [Terrimicrobiaceae bacterium]|nr:hypothetical protein [Terrimicrobiaceae bacterium]
KRRIIARAEWCRIGPLAARLGLVEARRYLVEGELRTALRFFLGALRRELRSMILAPETRGDARAIASGIDLHPE